MEITTTRCEDCPMYTIDTADQDYCRTGGTPHTRAYQDRNGEWVQYDTPNDCPLLKESITVKLIR